MALEVVGSFEEADLQSEKCEECRQTHRSERYGGESHQRPFKRFKGR